MKGKCFGRAVFAFMCLASVLAFCEDEEPSTYTLTASRQWVRKTVDKAKNELSTSFNAKTDKMTEDFKAETDGLSSALGNATNDLYETVGNATNDLRTALNHLYDITNNIPKELVYIAGYEDMSVNANVSNIWGYIVSNFYDKERRRDTFYLYITQNVTNQPAISFRYAAQSTTNWVQGTFVDWPNKTPISDGNELIDCYVCTATRPTAYRNVVVKVNTWLAFGGQTGFLWNGLVVFNDDELTHTGIHTNGDWEIVVDNGGVKSAIKTTTE